MKVLMINSVCGIRSTGRICTDLAKTIEQNGGEVKIAFGRYNVPSQYAKYAHRITTEAQVKFDGVLTRLFDNAGFNSKGATKRFLHWVKEYDPDIIHLHNLHGYYINVELLFDYLTEAKKPIVWTLHDCWPFTGHCTYFDFAGCNRWKNEGCRACPQKRAYPSSLLLSRSSQNYNKKHELFTAPASITFVSPSRWLADRVKKSFLQDYPVKVINNGIDLDTFSPQKSDFKMKYHLEEKKIVLGVAASWNERKGFADMLKLSTTLDDDYRIVLVGLAEEQKRALPSNIIGITKTDSAQALAEIYSAADVFVNTTYEDNFPTVNLEAQACGTPAITYRTGGSVESVPEENVVSVGDLEALKKAIVRIAETPSTAYREQALGVSKKYDKHLKYGEYIDLYSSLL